MNCENSHCGSSHAKCMLGLMALGLAGICLVRNIPDIMRYIKTYNR